MTSALPPAVQNPDRVGPLQSKGFEQLYAFAGPAGSGPAGLTSMGTALYGTATGGGTNSDGTVFVRGVSGKVRVLHNFAGGTDGSQPEGNLVELNGVLYGTTEYGGANNDGTVFSVTSAGAEKVLYSFKGGMDGATPMLAGLLVADGALYGTTNAGGDPSCHYQDIVGCGTVFKVTTAGNERVLYRFRGRPDGACPSSWLIDVNGVLYGTTNFGGTYDNGSVFQLPASGKESALYSFKGYPDGAMPVAGLTAVSGTFYGTTALGGAYDDSGTVFALTPSGTESVLHSFQGAPDGALPYAGLTASGGVLYGTTEYGGNTEEACIGRGIVGCGTIYAITPSGGITILYRLRGDKNGANPFAGLVSAGDSLYGTTFAGGSADDGTIFQIAP